MNESSSTQDTKLVSCPGCKGAGFYEVVPVGSVTCPGCDGTGKVRPHSARSRVQ